VMKPLAWNGSTCGRLFCAVPLLGVISIRRMAQESSVSWVERTVSWVERTTDFLGARNSYCAICALFDKQRYRMVRAVYTPDGMFHSPLAVTPISVLLCQFPRQELTSGACFRTIGPFYPPCMRQYSLSLSSSLSSVLRLRPRNQKTSLDRAIGKANKTKMASANAIHSPA